MPRDFRGKLRFTPERRLGCRACMRDCPAAAITIREVGAPVSEEVLAAVESLSAILLDALPRP